MKHRIASLVRQHCPDAKILELYQQYEGKVLTDADSWLPFPVDGPKELADRVNELAQEKRDAKSLRAYFGESFRPAGTLFLPSSFPAIYAWAKAVLRLV